MEIKLIGFEYLKDLSKDDEDFGGIFVQCTNQAVDRFHQVNGFLFREFKLCIPRSSTRELLIREVHGGGIAGHFGGDKTLSMLQENFIGHEWRSKCEVLFRDVLSANKQRPESNHKAFTLHCPPRVSLGTRKYGFCARIA
ncbi:hypothetical protein MLD38_010772 [Melastoma candidum]|uniref:Uncharacterized protein n=1 Tax=Melastoma candidum TaxID=119954 RepID=A0ACB9R273_9MYRT|nr:hypothetical protein MLD38_010772 [Melastoma candidum]